MGNRRVVNVGRHRKDPEGYYVATTDKEVFESIVNKVIELGLHYEFAGNLVIIRDKSWSRLRRLINYARELGIEVLID